MKTNWKQYYKDEIARLKDRLKWLQKDHPDWKADAAYCRSQIRLLKTKVNQ